MRIELFNRKTLHEFYEYNEERHIDFDSNKVRVSLTSREKTLGPDSIYAYVTVSNCVSRNAKFDVEKCIFKNLKNELMHHLNENVGVECLIKKEEVPIEIYERIKA